MERGGPGGQPYAGSLAYFALGGTAEADAKKGVGGYYEWLGDYATRSSAPWPKDEDTVKGYIQAFEGVGCGRADLLPELAGPGAGGPARAAAL